MLPLFVRQRSPCEDAALRSALRVCVLFTGERYVLERRLRGTSPISGVLTFCLG